MLELIFAFTQAFAGPRNGALPNGGGRLSAVPARVFIPDDADPCDFERFKADPQLGAWVRDISPNTATKANCFHTPAKILKPASALLAAADRKALTLQHGSNADLRAAALTGYLIDSLMEVERDGKKLVAILLKNGVNGPTLSQVYLAK